MKFWVVNGIIVRQEGINQHVQTFLWCGHAKTSEQMIDFATGEIIKNNPEWAIKTIFASDYTAMVYEFVAKFPEPIDKERPAPPRCGLD